MRLFLASVVFCYWLVAVAQPSPPERSQSKYDNTTRIVLVGDSTVTDGSGWGRGFKKCLGNGVECINAAQNGRSSKSYPRRGPLGTGARHEARFRSAPIRPQRSARQGPERESPADTEYRANMRRYVEEARAAGIQPILVTSLVRRKFAADGTIHSDLID